MAAAAMKISATRRSKAVATDRPTSAARLRPNQIR